jgi:hypothetical protein
MFAARVLKPGSYLIAYSGLAFLPQVLERVCKHIPYCWPIACLHADDQRALIRGRWVTNHYKMILTFRKPPMQPRSPNPDLLLGSGKEKNLHPWQQAEDEACRLIEWFSIENDLVCDPMFGSGTVALASVRLGRRFSGCDRDPSAVTTATKRLAEFYEGVPS